MDKEKALDAAVTQIERHFGKGSIMRMGDHPSGADVGVIPTGSLALDIALGVGGIPRGRIVEIYGPEASGKTTLVYHIIAEAQKLGGQCAFIDAEHAMDPIYAKAIGVNVDDLLVSQPDYGEQALEIAEMLIRSGALDVVAIDSVAALTPRAEIEGEMGDSFVGLQARLMSQALRKLAGTLNKSGTIAIFTNQLREKIGVMFGNPETTTGGKALKFYATIRLDIRRIETLKDGAEAIGNRVRVKVAKNKVAPPFSRPSSTSCTARASRARERCSTSASPARSCRRAAPSSASTTSVSGRGATTPASSSKRTATSPTPSRRASARKPGSCRSPAKLARRAMTRRRPGPSLWRESPQAQATRPAPATASRGRHSAATRAGRRGGRRPRCRP